MESMNISKLNNSTSLYATICDLNGVLRGKRIPSENTNKVLNGDIRMPLSAASVDIWGADIVLNGGVFESGDLDGICKPTGRGPIVTNDESTMPIIPLSLFTDEGEPYLVDPRQALVAVVERYTQKGLTPVVATELEFYLIDANQDKPQAPICPSNNKRLKHNAVLSLEELEGFEVFFNDVYKLCEQHDIPADTATSENGCGQFEINLMHSDDPLKAADDAIFFKHIVKSVARKHDMTASFMAKPYGDESGNGMHIHFSILDDDGNNIFDNGKDSGTDTLKYAINGLIQAMPESTLIFAPHYNSYRRLRIGTHAPTSIGWGYENRTAAIRVPGGNSTARRIEHRVAGADANPYLVLASVLGSALIGIESEQLPIKATIGNAYEADLASIPSNWPAAINAFHEGKLLPEILSHDLCNLYHACKTQELDKFASIVSDFEYQSYLEVV